jgi:preprotein translocase subunit SecG
MIVSAVCIILTTIQAGKTDAASSFTGSKNLALFANSKERGSDRIMMISTYVAVAAFLILALLSNIR